MACPLNVDTLTAEERVFWVLGGSQSPEDAEVAAAVAEHGLTGLPIAFWIARLFLFAANFTRPILPGIEIAGAHVVAYEQASRTRTVGLLEVLDPVTPEPSKNEYPRWYWMAQIMLHGSRLVSPEDPAVQEIMEHLGLNEVPVEFWTAFNGISEAREQYRARMAAAIVADM